MHRTPNQRPRDSRAELTFQGILQGVMWILLGLGTGACSTELSERPPLRDMELPLGWRQEPDDEAERLLLEAGSFTGVYVGDSRESLEALLDEPAGLVVTRLIENSPGAMAGVRVGDLILEVELEGEWTPLQYPSEWRSLELETAPGARLRVLVDRGGLEEEVDIVPVERVAPPDREPSEELREEERVGVVLRTPTEVEGRGVGLAPGAGAVVVGLAAASPWRKAGIRFGDTVVELEGETLGHPSVLVDAIRAADPEDDLRLTLARGEERLVVEARVARRRREWKNIDVPILYSFERDRDRTETSVLLGLFRYRRNSAAWDLRVLWLFRMHRGDADRLERVNS